jgi:cobalamin-dependent methionine synthase I
MNGVRTHNLRLALIVQIIVSATGLWISQGTLVSSTNKTDRHDITELWLKVVLSINPNPNPKL